MRGFDGLGRRKVVLGMVHLGALPGTPFYEEGSDEATFEKALADATALAEGGADGCLVQTVDRVYSPRDEADPARVAAVACIVRAIARATPPDFQVGVQIMRNALKASLAVARVCGGSYVRCGALVGATLTAHGLVEANPLDVLQYRALLGAGHVGLVAEVDSMHFKWLGGKPVGAVARAARGAGAAAVSLGDPDEDRTLAMIREVRQTAPDLPIVLAGYTTHANAARLLAEADGAFVGTCLERDGWGGRVDVARVRAYVEIVRALG
ncbi:MAG TPA: BtpA/SgcQ family protein [Thermomicrobiales bacterium]|nr:BtpA/SgcQ family protein [Thermomicrobiales bacterium]